VIDTIGLHAAGTISMTNLPGSREIPVLAVSSSRGHGVETLWDAIAAALASRWGN
jgi:hypothetical protein